MKHTKNDRKSPQQMTGGEMNHVLLRFKILPRMTPSKRLNKFLFSLTHLL